VPRGWWCPRGRGILPLQVERAVQAVSAILLRANGLRTPVKAQRVAASQLQIAAPGLP
jgi:hypothetical protein